MFWFGKKDKKKSKSSSAKSKPASAQSKTAREQLMAQALENARGARARLGDDTIQKIAEALSKKENSPFEQAKNRIKALDQGRVADNIKLMIDEE